MTGRVVTSSGIQLYGRRDDERETTVGTTERMGAVIGRSDPDQSSLEAFQ